MPPYPVEIVNFGATSFKRHINAIGILNSLQNEIAFSLPRQLNRAWAFPLDRAEYTTDLIWTKLREYRKFFKGFHPYIIAIVHGELRSTRLANLFGSHQAAEGLAVVTTKDWEEIFAPPSLDIYLAYYFVRYTLSFICPEVKTHDETRSCFFDRKLRKEDIKLSMASGKICDTCRALFEESVDGSSYEALQRLVGYIKEASAGRAGLPKPSLFLGSSSEGLKVAEEIQAGLMHHVDCTIWSQGVFGLSSGTLESLVRACASYQYAALILTPDDTAVKRGKEGSAPRDNVLFELGLFMGALGREKVFAVHRHGEVLNLPSDLAGVTLAEYVGRADGNLTAAMGPVCSAIKKAMGL